MNFKRQLEAFVQRSRECACRNVWTLHTIESSVYAKTKSLVGSFAIEVHIVFSNVYMMPTLFFSCLDRNQRAFQDTLVEIFRPEECLPAAMPFGLEEHPLFPGTLFWCLHPCRTGQIMTELSESDLQDDESFIASWLSIYGRCLGLDIPMNMLASGQQQ